MTRAGRKRVVVGACAALLVLGCQLWPPLLAGAYGTTVALVTLLAVVAFGLRTSGLVTGAVMITLAPVLTFVATRSIEREQLAHRSGASVVDGMVLLLIAASAGLGIAFGAWLDGHHQPWTVVKRARVSLILAAVMQQLALVASFAGRLGLADRLVTMGGMVLGLVLAVRAVRARQALDRDRDGREGRHRGDGWVDLDGRAPVHHAALVGSRAGVVTVFGLRDTPGDYRSGHAPDIRVVAGELAPWLEREERRIAGLYMLGAAASCASALKTFAAAALALG